MLHRVMNKITLEHFKKNLEEQIAKIELQALDDEAVSSISLHFHKDTSSFKMDLYEDLTHDVVLDLEMLQLSGFERTFFQFLIGFLIRRERSHQQLCNLCNSCNV